jgi:hypothetical protein
MHARRQILNAIRSALESRSSLGAPVFEEEATAEGRCFQYAASADSPRAGHEDRDARVLVARVSARGLTPEDRDNLSEALEQALLGAPPLGAFDIHLAHVELHCDSGGRTRHYDSHYTLQVTYRVARGAPGVLV